MCIKSARERESEFNAICSLNCSPSLQTVAKKPTQTSQHSQLNCHNLCLQTWRIYTHTHTTTHRLAYEVGCALARLPGRANFLYKTNKQKAKVNKRKLSAPSTNEGTKGMQQQQQQQQEEASTKSEARDTLQRGVMLRPPDGPPRSSLPTQLSHCHWVWQNYHTPLLTALGTGLAS